VLLCVTKKKNASFRKLVAAKRAAEEVESAREGRRRRFLFFTIFVFSISPFLIVAPFQLFLVLNFDNLDPSAMTTAEIEANVAPPAGKRERGGV